MDDEGVPVAGAAAAASSIAATRVELPDGRFYIGQVNAAGQPHGQGMLIHSEMRFEGEFAGGKRNGLCAAWVTLGGDEDAELFECGRWKDDILVDKCAVPLKLMPEGRWLHATGQTAAEATSLHRASVALAPLLIFLAARRASVQPNSPRSLILTIPLCWTMDRISWGT